MCVLYFQRPEDHFCIIFRDGEGGDEALKEGTLFGPNMLVSKDDVAAVGEER